MVEGHQKLPLSASSWTVFRRFFWIYFLGVGTRFLYVWLVLLVLGVLFSYVGKTQFDADFFLLRIAAFMVLITAIFASCMGIVWALEFRKNRKHARNDEDG